MTFKNLTYRISRSFLLSLIMIKCQFYLLSIGFFPKTLIPFFDFLTNGSITQNVDQLKSIQTQIDDLKKLLQQDVKINQSNRVMNIIGYHEVFYSTLFIGGVALLFYFYFAGGSSDSMLANLTTETAKTIQQTNVSTSKEILSGMEQFSNLLQTSILDCHSKSQIFLHNNVIAKLNHINDAVMSLVHSPSNGVSGDVSGGTSTDLIASAGGGFTPDHIDFSSMKTDE